MTVEKLENLVEFPPFRIPAEFRHSAGAAALVVLLPALGTAMAYYRPFAESLSARGYAVLSPELPGTGASQPRPSWKVDYGYSDLVARYFISLIEGAGKFAAGRPIVVAGHSLGAQIGMLALTHGLASIDALVTIAGGHIHFKNWDGLAAGKVLVGAWLAASLTRLFGHLPGQYIGFGGPQARTLIREWSRTIRSGRFPELRGSQSGVGGIPCLSIAYEGDPMAPSNSVAAMAEMLQADLMTLAVTGPGNPHSDWARNPEATVETIDAWLGGNLAGGLQ